MFSENNHGSSVTISEIEMWQRGITMQIQGKL
jgi:hypothetical protein